MSASNNGIDNLLVFEKEDDFVTYPREVLNQLRWKPGENLSDASITYVHRGAPGDEMTISGDEIVELERSFFVTKDAKIPYHRIKMVRYRGKIIFDIQKASLREPSEKMKA
jgi:uncharacterized protein